MACGDQIMTDNVNAANESNNEDRHNAKPAPERLRLVRL